MSIPDVPGPLPYVSNPPLAYRFTVVFLVRGVIPNPIDTLFQKVSGLNYTVSTSSVNEGGQNLYTQDLPDRVGHDNLKLERGLMNLSPLAYQFMAVMNEFNYKSLLQPAKMTVLVSLLDNGYAPLYNWMCLNAFPVSWSVGDLDANSNSVVIETLEFSYQHLRTIRL